MPGTVSVDLWYPGKDNLPSPVTEGADVRPWHNRDGAYITRSAVEAWRRQGRLYLANAGTITTPITFGAGDILETEPDLDVSVPEGHMIIPLFVKVVLEGIGTSAQLEGMIAYGAGTPGARTGGTVARISNMRTNSGRASTLNNSPSLTTHGIYSNVDAAGATYQTLNIAELHRWRVEMTVDIVTAIDTSSHPKVEFVYSYLTDAPPPEIVGGSGTNYGRLNVFLASQAGTGFITLVYAEFGPGEF